MKKTLLLFLLFLPFFGFSQTDLVKWDAHDVTTTEATKKALVLNSDITSADLKVSTQTPQPSFDYNNGWDPSPFFMTGNWPNPQQNGGSYDSSRYIEFTIAPTANHKIDLSKFNLTYRSQGGSNTQKFIIRYSKDPTFTNNVKVLTSGTATNNWTPINPSFDAAINPVIPGDVVYIRLYVYNSNDNFHLKTGTGASRSPATITGTVTAYNPALQAFNDAATSIKNNFTLINVIANDLLASPSKPITSVTIASQPANSEGTAVVNTTDKTIKFTPAVGFTGSTSFTYTAGDGNTTSTATVNVTVSEPATSDLIKWNGTTTFDPTILASPITAVSAGNLTSDALFPVTAVDYDGFKKTGWPTNFAKDDAKYFQVTAKAETGYKLKLNSFNFTYNGESHVDVLRYQVRYSKDNFVTSYLLVDEATTTGKVNKSLSLANLTLTAGETLTIRIYGYKLMVFGDLGAPIFLANSHTIGAGNTTPTITGTVLLYDAVDINANDDNVTTRKNTPLKINTLNNDTQGASAITNVTIANQPAAGQGTVIVNSDKSITFTPANNFTGETSFKYTIVNSTQSATATVFVKVEEATHSLIIWNGLSQQPIAALSDTNITATNITGTGMTFNPNANSGFRINAAPTTLDYTKYVQVSVSPKAGYKIDLTQFKFTYISTSALNGPKKYQVRYSLDPAFQSNGTSLIAETTAIRDTQTTVSVNFPAGVTAVENKTVYIRIYVYDTTTDYSDYYLVHDNGGDLGPTIQGIVSDVNTLTAIYDDVTTVRNQAVTIPVLANDTRGSIALQPITISTQSLNGTATVSGENVIFTPANGFTGSTSFVYTLSNGSTTSSAIVYITVTDPPCVAALTPGNEYWKGYVYTYTNIPALTTYVGSVAENANFERNVEYGTITGNQTVEVDNFCGPVPAETFMVRYLMETTTIADTYSFTIGGDDGVRLYIDGNLVTLNPADSWTDHGYQTYNALYPLTAGKHTFALEYYEKGGIARVSFIHGALSANASLPFGINKWNVYGFNSPDIELQPGSLAGSYVDPSININTQAFWDKDKSPSSYSGWQGVTIPIDNFAVSYRRQGFPCGRYQLEIPNIDDIVRIYIDGVEIFYHEGYRTDNMVVNQGTLYFLNENSKVEVRLRENGGDANIAVKFIDTPSLYTTGSGTISPNTTSIRISSNADLKNDIEVCSCTIDPNVTFTIPSGKTLKVTETITVATGGKLLLKDGASLLQKNTNANAYQGNLESFELQRDTKPVRRYDLTYWSSPLTTSSGITLSKLSPETLGDKYYSYKPNSGWVIDYNGTLPMVPGQGYNVRAPQTFDIDTPAIYHAKFVGLPNNGDIPLNTLVPAAWNLVGNPYPSAIDAVKFISVNNAGALYFWTHTTAPANSIPGDSHYYYSSADYAVFTLLGGTGTASGTPGATGNIASGQAFFMKAATTNITFTNDMRVGMEGKNDQFFKSTEAKTTAVNRNRLWLNFTNAGGGFKQALLGYMDGATNLWDVAYDAATLNGNTFIDFYSINDSRKLTVQGRALPFDDSETIPLGYKTSIEGDFTISIDHTDGFFNNQAVYLEDKTTGKTQDLRAGNYTFTTAIGTFTERFVLRYTNKTLGTGDFEDSDNTLLVSVKDKVIKVNTAKENIKEVAIYDISGNLIYSKKKIGSTELQISNLQSGNQVLIVKVNLENDYTISKKIIFK